MEEGDYLFSCKTMVYSIMVQYPETKKNDMLLFGKLVEEYDPDNSSLSFTEYSSSGKFNYATVIRERRQLQIDFPDLIDPDTKRNREDLEIEYRDHFSRS